MPSPIKKSILPEALKSMVRASIRIILPIGQQKGVTEILGRYAERTRFLAGCLSCRLYHDVLDPKAIMLEEVWDDESALNRHLGSDSFRDILLVIEMASAAPEVSFIQFSEFSGLERIERVRGDGSVA
jgi:quinol monooxygenase YgiN